MVKSDRFHSGLIGEFLLPQTSCNQPLFVNFRIPIIVWMQFPHSIDAANVEIVGVELELSLEVVVDSLDQPICPWFE